MEFTSECWSCNLLILTQSALSSYDQHVYEQLANAVMTTGAAITTIALIVTIIMRTQVGLDASAGPETANEVFGTLARLAWCTGILASFPFWKNGVVGIIDNAIASVTYVALEVIPHQNQEQAPPGSPQNLEYALQSLATTEHAIFEPLSKITKAVNEQFGGNPLAYLTDGASAFLIYIIISFMMVLGVLDIFVVLLFYGEFIFWRFLVVAFGPLIIFAWVFPATRSAAWTAMKVLIQSGLTIIMISGVVAIIVSAYAGMTDGLGLTVDEVDAEKMTDLFSVGGALHAMLVQIFAIGLFFAVKLMALFIVFGSAGQSMGRGVTRFVGRFTGR